MLHLHGVSAALLGLIGVRKDFREPMNRDCRVDVIGCGRHDPVHDTVELSRVVGPNDELLCEFVTILLGGLDATRLDELAVVSLCC